VAAQRPWRVDIVLMCICPHSYRLQTSLSGAWIGRQHGVSREGPTDLRKDFASFIAPYIQFSAASDFATEAMRLINHLDDDGLPSP